MFISYWINLYDLALCIDNNEEMTLLGPQINYMRSKSHVSALFQTPIAMIEKRVLQGNVTWQSSLFINQN